MNENILGGRLSIEDGFTSPLEKFANKILGAENRIKQFTNSVSNSTQKIATEGTKTYQQVDKIAARFVQQGDKVANAINKANDRVRQNQEKTIEGLSQKYIKLGMNIQQAYSKAEHDSNNIWNGGGGSNNGGTGGSDALKDFAQSFLQSGIGGIIGKLGLIGAGITAGITVMKTLNNWMEQGFGILNKVSDGLLSPEGIKNAIEESMNFETGRMKLDLFYGGKEKGLDAYQTATFEAQKTYASETDTVSIMAKLGQLGVNSSKDQLEKLLDVAGTREEVSTDHIGLAVKEAIEGRVAMLQMYGINNRNLKKYYDSLKKSSPKEYKEFKGALSKKGAAGDPQKYYNLLTTYIEQSPMNGYAETYAKTVKGKIERMTGVWETLKAEIMGIDVKTGTAKEGGVFAAVAKNVDDLKDLLEDKNTVDSIEKIGKSFGNVFTSIGGAFTKVLTPETIDKVANAITKIGEALAKMIDRFVESGQLDKLLERLPDLTEKVVGNEVINKTTDFKVATDLVSGDYGKAIDDWIRGKADWNRNTFGINKDEGLISQEGDEKYYAGNGWLSDLWNEFRASNGEMLSDANASTYIDKNVNLTDDQKQSLKDYIKNDNASVYNNVTIGTILANNYDEIMQSIEAAAPNRK